MADNNNMFFDQDLDDAGFTRLSRRNQSVDVDMPDAEAVHEKSHAERVPRDPSDRFPSEDIDVIDQISTTNGTRQTESIGRKFIIALDFGTTTSSIAFVCVDPSEPEDLIPSQRIQCIDHYPDTPRGVSASAHAGNTTVPTELWYATKTADIGHNGAGTDMVDPDADDGNDSPLDDGARGSTPPDSDHERYSPLPPPKQEAKRHPPIWGYGVQKKISMLDEVGVKSIHMSLFKLLLDEDTRSEELRQRAWSAFKILKLARLVREPEDVISDYLELLFRHAKSRLVNFYDLQDVDDVQFVLCVPTMWTEKACRVMQNAMMRAIEVSQLGRLENGCIKDLFIVSEPEAAAAYALSDISYASRIHPGETFLVLDCGGGTVDAITYQLTQINPIRVNEVVEPKGVSCGASLLNENFHKLLETRLDGATSRLDMAMSKQITSTVVDWENGSKRHIDVTDKTAKLDPVYIPGLVEDGSRGIGSNHLKVSYPEMKNVFKGCLRKTADLLREQLRSAKEAGFAVQKVVLVGGFGHSPSLENHLKGVLAGERNSLRQPIKLMLPNYVDSAVARGAVLRALNKENGPTRISRTSYGIIFDDLFDRSLPEHQGLKGRTDPIDGELYIKNTIHWQILQGDVVPANRVIRIRRRHIFKQNWKRLVASEYLWVSGRRHKSGYRISHQENKGAEQLGKIIVDLTQLTAQPDKYLKSFYNAKGISHSFWEIEFDLCLIIDGRNLRFEACSPENPHEVAKSKMFSIAASFEPGTA